MAAVRKPPTPAPPAGDRAPEGELGPRKLIRFATVALPLVMKLRR